LTLTLLLTLWLTLLIRFSALAGLVLSTTLALLVRLCALRFLTPLPTTVVA
jgi:hypothetical protein